MNLKDFDYFVSLELWSFVRVVKELREGYGVL